jgi:hypothetical protein
MLVPIMMLILWWIQYAQGIAWLRKALGVHCTLWFYGQVISKVILERLCGVDKFSFVINILMHDSCGNNLQSTSILE